MKIYIKNGEAKQSNQIVINKNGKNIFNPIESMILEDGWVEYVPIIKEPTEVELFEKAKSKLIENILEYDSSEHVNIFYIGDYGMWLDKATRVGLKLRFEMEMENGEDMTSLWHNGNKFELPIEMAVKLLYSIEKYASQCYDNTQYHISVANKLDNILDVENYDYKMSYPEKLVFNL